MKRIFKSISAIVLIFAFVLSLTTTVFANGNSVTVSLNGENCGLTAGAVYKVSLKVSDASIGGLQGSLKFNTANFDFQNVTVPNSIARINRLTKGDKDITTAKDIVVVNETGGTIDFVVLSDKASNELLTFNFKVSSNAANIKSSSFSLNSVKVSQKSGAKRVETLGIINITASSHQYGEWALTKKPTLYTEGEKNRTCSVCGKVETAKVDKLAASKAEIKLLGATRIVLVKEENREYSLDANNWQSSNVITGLTKNTEYKIYSRLVDSSSGSVSGVSEALNVTTSEMDGIIGNVQAEDLSGLRKILFFEEKYAWADVNGDVSIDIRDIIRLKKASAGYYDKYKSGDFNLDGNLDSLDYEILSNYLNGSSENIFYYIGDVNSDGKLDINDLNAIN